MDREHASACVVSPNVKDADLAVRFLRSSGIEARAFPSLHELAAALDDTVGCVILVEEALVNEAIFAMREALQRRPAWSDLPLIAVASDVAVLRVLIANAFPTSGNVTLLERPLNPHTLVSAVEVALRATARQRHVGDLLAQREQAVKLRDEFLAMLAHELRNPLAPILNAVYLMSKAKTDEPLVHKAREVLDRQVGQVVRIVDDLMDVARLERGKVALKKERADLNRIVASAIETAMHTAQERGHRISARFSVEPLWAEVDPVRMEQVICNLVNNAAKFSHQPDEIRVETAQDGAFAALSVQDQGVGFEPAAAEKLFVPFVQVNPTLARSGGGLGIGLTIVRRLVELHGGFVDASSGGPGKGSRFVVRIPLATSTAQPSAPVRDMPPIGSRSQRVVVIEDNADIRETLQLLLTMWGHEVALAADGVSGVERVLKEAPDVALIDIGLPGMNGYDVARAIRSSMPNGQIRLIALTGYGQPADRELALQAGFDAHVLKPIVPQTLERMLAE